MNWLKWGPRCATALALSVSLNVALGIGWLRVRDDMKDIRKRMEKIERSPFYEPATNN